MNFSVRQNKAIERRLVFEGLQKYGNFVDLRAGAYIGLGSAWFVDFEHAHRELGISTMISMEADEVTFARAKFNRPYKTVEIAQGLSYDLSPSLLERSDLRDRPWTVWLDYDSVLDEASVEELVRLAERAPAGSALITTFNAHPRSYGDTNSECLQRFVDLLGDAFPAEQHPQGKGLANHANTQRALAASVSTLLDSATRTSARPGGFVSAFEIQYTDGAPMVTVGGFLPPPDLRESVAALVESPDWRGFSAEPIDTPPLTPKEIAALRALLPADPIPSRDDVIELGFDLDESHLKAFVTYYLDYPIYVQAAR